ncbi:MAG: nucleoside 2-deoxyribosyltransferase domain-containing protein [Sedimenticola sp.]
MKSKIYLAGGFKSKWQVIVNNHLSNKYILYDPSMHNIGNPSEYVQWDLAAIDQSDIVLAYMEASNPGGYALALEIGYAKALNKRIILVDEHSSKTRERYFEMVRYVSDKRFNTLDEAIRFLA